MSGMETASEYKFDGLVGPTHNYAGLSFGNVASELNAGTMSSPKEAALQGLKKMKLLMDLGVPQAVIPPHQRPNFALLRNMGFTGDINQMIQKANKYDPMLVAVAYSAASMWVANMATVSPSADTYDHKVHITPANLTFNLHRAQEVEFAYELSKKIFADEKVFNVHPPLPSYRGLSDEGQANTFRLAKNYGSAGIEVFVYGLLALGGTPQHPRHFRPRQVRLASSSVMRNHQLNEGRCLMMQQSPKAIDAGVFHNDVICLVNKNIMFYHKDAYVEWDAEKKVIQEFLGNDGHMIEISDEQLTMPEAVETYIFNSQLVSLANGDTIFIAPIECQKNPKTKQLLDSIVAQNNPIKDVKYVELHQSMRNGGGPGCLRLKVVLTPEEAKGVHPGVILTNDLYTKLEAWIEEHYRETLAADDLLDPTLPNEVCTALDQLTKLLNLGSIYPFQKT